MECLLGNPSWIYLEPTWPLFLLERTLFWRVQVVAGFNCKNICQLGHLHHCSPIFRVKVAITQESNKTPNYLAIFVTKEESKTCLEMPQQKSKKRLQYVMGNPSSQKSRAEKNMKAQPRLRISSCKLSCPISEAASSLSWSDLSWLMSNTMLRRLGHGWWWWWWW